MGKGHQEGFTLIELMAVLMVLAIVLGMGIPAMGDLVASNQMARAANDLLATLQAARQAALASNAPVTVCASNDWDKVYPTCSGGAQLLSGWIVFRDANGNGLLDAAENAGILGRSGPLSDDIRNNAHSRTDAGPSQYVLFGSDGRPKDAGGLGPAVHNIQLCDRRGARDTGGGIAAGRWLLLTPTGHALAFQDVAHVQGPDNPLGGC